MMGVGHLRVLETQLEVIRSLHWHKLAGKHTHNNTQDKSKKNTNTNHSMYENRI